MEKNRKNSYLIVCAVYLLFLYILLNRSGTKSACFFLLGIKWILKRKKQQLNKEECDGK